MLVDFGCERSGAGADGALPSLRVRADGVLTPIVLYGRSLTPRNSVQSMASATKASERSEHAGFWQATTKVPRTKTLPSSRGS